MGGEFNVVGPCVLLNPKAPPAERYLAIFDSYTRYRPGSPESKTDARAVYAATSPDGLDFTPDKGRLIVPGKSDIGQSAVWNPERGKLQLYLRCVNEYADEKGLRQRVRYVRYSESDDGRQWSGPIELMKSDEDDGAPDNQFHQLTVTRYGSVYIGLLTLFRIENLELGGEHRGETFDRLEHGVTDTQLAFSRDGLHWVRVGGRETFLPRRAPGQWDAAWIVTSSELVAAEDEVRLYYAGFPHRFSVGETAIGVATFPLDRFVAMRPQRLNGEAILEMKPLRYSGDVVLNAEAAPGGSIRAELLDFGGNVLKGFEKESFTPIRGDGLRHELRWKSKTILDVAAHPGEKPVRLRFYLKNARLYSLRYASMQYGAKPWESPEAP